MCTHLHHDHVGWNTQQKDGKWVPTFPNARYVFSKPDVDYFSKVDADPKEGPAELGTFRECVVPILEHGRADLVSGGPYRLNEFIEIEFGAGPFARPRVLQDREQRQAGGLHRRCLASSVAGLLSRLEFPEEFRRRASAREPAQGARLLRFKRRAGVSGPRRLAVSRAISRRRKKATGRISNRDRSEAVKLGGIVHQDFLARVLVGHPIEQHIQHQGIVWHLHAWCRMRPIGGP